MALSVSSQNWLAYQRKKIDANELADPLVGVMDDLGLYVPIRLSRSELAQLFGAAKHARRALPNYIVRLVTAWFLERDITLDCTESELKWSEHPAAIRYTATTAYYVHLPIAITAVLFTAATTHDTLVSHELAKVLNNAHR